MKNEIGKNDKKSKKSVAKKRSNHLFVEIINNAPKRIKSPKRWGKS
jgi:hypothetical protein